MSVASIGRKLRHFHTPPLFSGPAGGDPSEFREDLDIHKTRMNGISCGAESMTYVQPFLSRVSILLLTRDIDIVILSVRLSVCP